jgi:peptidoglycan/LPS O-acetylase OafA/YrhL
LIPAARSTNLNRATSGSADGVAPVASAVVVVPHKLAVIDAARGWAIFLVIVSHVGGLFPELPWPLKRMTNFGWFGVQLFFVVSAYTLLASWYRDSRPLGTKTTDFLIRRFFRIAPMYYLGLVLYLVLRPPGDRFSWEMLVTTMLFINAWTPDWLAVERGSWVVVPGGWSVSVEFTFYMLFPLFALLVSSLKRASLAVAFSAVLAAVSYRLGNAYFADAVVSEALGNFLFFWFPSQLVIFAVGAVLFHMARQGTLNFRYPSVWLAGLTGLLCLLTQTHSGKFWFVDGWMPPSYFLAAAVFGGVVLLLLRADNPNRIFVNPLICRLGEASFSAYVLHWAFLDLAHNLPELINLRASGFEAIAAFFVTLVVVSVCVYFVARLTHLHFEQFFIRMGRQVGRRVSGQS